MQRAGIFSINVWDFLAFMRIIFNSDHWIRKQQQQSRWNDKLPVSAVLWRLFTSQPPQNVADLIMFAGCLKISQYRVTLPRTGQALSWHLRPADRRVTTTGYCYNLQSSIQRTIGVLWWRLPLTHSYQGPTQRSRVERWYGKTGLTAIKTPGVSLLQFPG